MQIARYIRAFSHLVDEDGGLSEFRFWPKMGTKAERRIVVRARSGDFQTTVSLRRGTSDFRAFRQVFFRNNFNLRRTGRWDEIQKIYESQARTGIPLILDLGANIGLASLYFSKNWPEARIIALEPEEQNYQLACKNLSGHANVFPIKAAVAAEDAAVTIINPSAEAWAYRTAVSDTNGGGAIDAMSVSTLIARSPELSRLRPFLVKVDIEGFEQNLFSKNTEWIARFPIMIVELHDWLLPGQATSKNFLQTIGQYDRDFLNLGDDFVSIANNFAANGSPPGRSHD